MRMLHTSDWHLGRTLHRADLREAQAGYLDHLVETVSSERIDAVLVSGDVYDRAIPPVDAVALCEDGLARLRDAGARVVVISGNHDSARRLGFASALVDQAGVHLRTRAGSLAQPVLLEDRHGPVAVYGVPFLEPDAVRHDLPPSPVNLKGPANLKNSINLKNSVNLKNPSSHTSPDSDSAPRGHQGVLTRATDCIRADLATRHTPRSVVMAHAWVTGGEASESERDISVGGVGRVPAGLFDGFSYTALGHLHGPQTLGERLRYSGSPLPYSFSEARQRKGSWLVDLDGQGNIQVERVPAPAFRRLSTLRGPLSDLLTSPSYTEHEDDFVSVVLTDTGRPEGAMEQLRRRFPHVLVLTFDPDGTEGGGGTYRSRVKGRDDLAVAAEFVRHVRSRDVTGGERDLLAAAFDAARRAEGED